MLLPFLVEAAGIEPASEDLQPKISTCLFRVLILVRQDPLEPGSVKTSPLNISPHFQQARKLGYPASLAPSIPAGEKQRDASLRG